LNATKVAVYFCARPNSTVFFRNTVPGKDKGTRMERFENRWMLMMWNSTLFRNEQFAAIA
jgi:hypothetical protein